MARVDDGFEIASHDIDALAAQTIVRTELQHDDIWLVCLERGADARRTAGGGFAADARIRDAIIELFILQPLLEQICPATLWGSP